MTVLQGITAGFFVICGAFIILVIFRTIQRLICVKERRQNGKKPPDAENPEDAVSLTPSVEEPDQLFDVLYALAKLGIIMAYFYLCDRTNLFGTAKKEYSHLTFTTVLLILLILGLIFSKKADKTTLLNRDQTDEWKGWMQLVILTYHYIGASKIVPIYMHVRVLVSSYLFLTGYAHFFYFWNKGDFSLYRLCQILFRMNLLGICLCLVMDRSYQGYYFLPLVSFWFITVYVIMAMWPVALAKMAEKNGRQNSYLIFKMTVAVVVISVFYFAPVLFEKTFNIPPIDGFFKFGDSLHEWRFRWELDRYTVVGGMVFGFVCFYLSKRGTLVDGSENAMFSTKLAYVVLFASAAQMMVFTAFTVTCGDKVKCNSVYPYFSYVPVISFILLRNTPGWMRVRFSYFFAWFGKISLELFISQYHIWLADDAGMVLVLIPGHPIINVLVSGFLFVSVCLEIHEVTSVLTPLVVPKEPKKLLRNVVLFVVVILTIYLRNTEGVKAVLHKTIPLSTAYL